MIMQQLRSLLILLMLVTLTACSNFLKQEDEPASLLENTTQAAVNWSGKAIRLFNQANEYRENDHKKAANLFKQAILIEPKMEAAYFNLMRLYLDNSMVEEMQLVSLDAENNQLLSARMLNLLATEKRTKGEFKQAEKLYLTALTKNPLQLSVLANMAILQDLYLHNLLEAQGYYLQYQQQLIVEGKEDKRLANWLADINRRVAALNKESS